MEVHQSKGQNRDLVVGHKGKFPESQKKFTPFSKKKTLGAKKATISNKATSKY
jgi:predicted ribosome quality control (RQC) complex YloA/Tae2 family protein